MALNVIHRMTKFSYFCFICFSNKIEVTYKIEIKLYIFFAWKKREQKNLVCLYWSGYYTKRTHRRDPTTARRGHFELLDFSPGPNRTSLDNLATPGSPRVSMLTPSLVRTLVQRVTQCSRTPVLKPSSNSGLPIAWITEPATDSSLSEIVNCVWIFRHGFESHYKFMFLFLL